jgi:hypothetical protein
MTAIEHRLGCTYAAGQPALLKIPTFDPSSSILVAEPQGEGAGWWAGAPGALHDPTDDSIYVAYRQRKPRELGRGGLVRIIRTINGTTFEPVWEATKDDFQTASIERSVLVKVEGGPYRLYVSYVDPSDSRWRIDLLEADHPAHFDPQTRQHALTAADIHGEAVKDPLVFTVGGLWHMIVSYVPSPISDSDGLRARLHASADVYATGLLTNLSGLAVSGDGIEWNWVGPVMEPRPSGWDAYSTRLSGITREEGFFLGYYNGCPTVAENYEELTGLAISFDLRRWERITPDGPALTSPHASGSLRYVFPVRLPEGGTMYFFESARSDGSHELRMSHAD